MSIIPRPSVMSWNASVSVREDKISLAASGLLEAFKKMWPDAWGVRMEHVLRNALLTLLEQPEATLADILRLLDDKAFRSAAVARITNEQVRQFWITEYDHYPARLRAEAIAPIQNKVGAYLADPTLRRILTNPEKPLQLRRIMDEGKILIVNLARGQLGEDTTSLLGALLVTTGRWPHSAALRWNRPNGARSSSTSTSSRASRPGASPR
jgi:hypothetical protein